MSPITSGRGSIDGKMEAKLQLNSLPDKRQLTQQLQPKERLDSIFRRIGTEESNNVRMSNQSARWLG